MTGQRWVSVCASVALALFAVQGASGNPILVKADATCPTDPCNDVCDGESWECAFTDLWTVLHNASSGDDVWVAEGIYRPDESAQYKYFEINSGVEVYGVSTGQKNCAASETRRKT